MSYSKPEQMSDQEFYISVEQVPLFLAKKNHGQQGHDHRDHHHLQHIIMIITTILGSNSSPAMPSPIRASPNSLLVLRQQQLAPAGDPSSQLPCYTILSSLFSFLVI